MKPIRRRRTHYAPFEWVYLDLKHGELTTETILHNLQVVDSRIKDIQNDMVTGRLQHARLIADYMQHISDVLQYYAQLILEKESELNARAEI